MLTVRQYAVGPFQSNAYLVWDAAPGEALLVDAGAEAPRLLRELDENDLTLTAILQTHAHADHIAALPELVAATGAPVYLHPDARSMLISAEENLSAFAAIPITAPVETLAVTEADELNLLDRDIQIYHTPGHAPGSVCYHFVDDGIVFTGDALFAGSIGRTDFPGGSYDLLIDRIKEKLLVLPDETRVYSGHMGPTTIGHERETNPFL
jgi:glyoxylase-like metal-dependent hydrolase (beta-lactamase superfamily II)